MQPAIRTFGLLSAIALGACSSASTPAQATDHGSDAGAGNAPDDASTDAGRPPPVPCSTPVEDRPPGATCVLEARGTVTDLDGVPQGDLVVTMCGRTCFGAHSLSDGSFVVPVGDFVNRENYAVHVDGRPDHADTYLRLGKGDSEVIALTAPLLVPSLPANGPLLPADGAAASSITSGDVTFAVADATTFDLNVEDFGTDAGRMLRVASVPLAKAPPFVHDANVEAVYAMMPDGAKASAKMGVTLVNAAALPAGIAVDVLILGEDYISSPPTVGIMSVAASAHVSADGKTIQTDPGEGIVDINWLGVRRKGT